MSQVCLLEHVDSVTHGLQKNFPKILSSNEIYYSGTFPMRDRFHLGIIGSRRPSPESSTILSKLFEKLKAYNIRIISGGALGVDAQAHIFAMRFGLPTYSWIVGNPATP